jgi:hypothetical protein
VENSALDIVENVNKMAIVSVGEVAGTIREHSYSMNCKGEVNAMRTGNNFVDALQQEQNELQNRLGIINNLLQSYQNDPHNYSTSGGQGSGMQGNSDQQTGFGNSGNNGIRGSREINRSINQGGFGGGNNQSFQSRQGNNQQFGNANKGDDANQRVTTEGRVEHDADGIDPQQLQQWLNNPDQRFLNQDGSYDRRTMEGRALYAAGLIGDDGTPINNRGSQVVTSRS